MRLFFTTLILIFTTWAQAAWQVEFKSLPEAIKLQLIQKFPNLDKEKISPAKMDEIIQWAHSQLGADRVDFIETKPGTVTLSIQRVPKIGQVNFSGLSAISEMEARSFVLFNINDNYNENLLIESGEKLRQFYKNLGYLNAEIDVEMPTDEKGQLILNFIVRENKKTEISDIYFELTNEDLKKALKKTSRSFMRKTFMDNTISDIQLALRETINQEGSYLTEISGPEARFNADETKVELFYKLSKTDHYEIDIRGHQDLTKSTIEDILDLKNYNSANPNLAAELAQKVKIAYLKRGYARVEVQAEEGEGRNNQTKLITINIEEGARVEIDKYVITGRFSRDEEYYSEFIRKNSTELIKDGFYNAEDLDTGFINLVTHLRNQGNLLAKIISKRTQYNRGRDKITIYINLDEGPLTRVDSIEFQGNNSIRADELSEILDFEKDEALKLNKLEFAIQKIKNYYYEKGFIDMVLLNEKEDLVIYNADNTRAQLKFKIHEGPLVRVASILIDGNYFTKDYVILNEIELPVGEIVTPSKIEESIARLQRVGHFTAVEVRTLEEKTNVSDRTLLVRVTERNPGEFRLGFGVTNERQLTLRGYSGIGYSNLWGTGRGVSLRLEGNYNVADVKYLENKVTVGYLEPYLFNTRVRGRINLTRSKTVTDYERREGTEVNQTTWSAEKNFTSHILGIWDVYNLATFKEFAIDDRSAKDINETPLNIASTGPTVDIDYRDNISNPTNGTFTQFSSEYASPSWGSSKTIEFWRSTATFKYYKKLAPGPWVSATAFRFGLLQNLSSLIDGGVPYDKKGFILGGRSTLRGYEAGTSEVFPNRRDLGSESYVLSSRAKMGLFKTELQFPIWGQFSGALFYDGGYVEIEGLKFMEYYRDSVGFGFRYNTPVGPLNFEYGWKLDRREDEETGRIHISIGTM